MAVSCAREIQKHIFRLPPLPPTFIRQHDSLKECCLQGSLAQMLSSSVWNEHALCQFMLLMHCIVLCVQFSMCVCTGSGLERYVLSLTFQQKRLLAFASAPFAESFMKKVRLQTGAALKHLPSHILYENARLQTGADLKHVPLQILYKKLRKGLITDWSWSAPPSLTNPRRKAVKRHDYRLKLVWNTLAYNGETAGE